MSGAILARLTEAYAQWERGEEPSPSARDLVFLASDETGRGLRAEDAEVLADEVHDMQSAGAELSEVAEHLAKRFAFRP